MKDFKIATKYNVFTKEHRVIKICKKSNLNGFCFYILARELEMITEKLALEKASEEKEHQEKLFNNKYKDLIT